MSWKCKCLGKKSQKSQDLLLLLLLLLHLCISVVPLVGNSHTREKENTTPPHGVSRFSRFPWNLRRRDLPIDHAMNLLSIKKTLLLFTNVIRNSNLLAIALTSVQQPIFLCSTCVLHIFQRKAVEYELAIMHLNRTDALELAKPTIGMSTTELLALTTVSK